MKATYSGSVLMIIVTFQCGVSSGYTDADGYAGVSEPGSVSAL